MGQSFLRVHIVHRPDHRGIIVQEDVLPLQIANAAKSPAYQEAKLDGVPSPLFPNLSQNLVEVIPFQEPLPDVIFFQFLKDRSTVQLVQSDGNVQRALKCADFPVDRCWLCAFSKSLELILLYQWSGYIDSPSPSEEWLKVFKVIAECYQRCPFLDRVIIFDQLDEIVKEKFIFGRTNEAVGVDLRYSLT